MPWGYAAVAVGSIIAADKQAGAGEKGASTQARASREATEENRRQFDITQQNLQPWLKAGSAALDKQNAFLNGDWSGFYNSPDYKFATEQGFKGLDAGAAARGNLWGGGADADRIALGQGLATQYANNFWNRLSGLSGTGQNTATQLGQFGQAYGQQFGQNAMNAANARASSYANSANAWGNAANQLGSLAGQYYGQRQNNGTNYFGWGGV